TLVHPAGFVADWTTPNLHSRVLARHRLADTTYQLSQLRYDLSKLHAKGLVERIGASRRYRLTPLGLKLGVLLVKLRMRLLGPLATIATAPCARRTSTSSNSVDIAFHQVDVALDQLSAALGLKTAA